MGNEILARSHTIAAREVHTGLHTRALQDTRTLKKNIVSRPPPLTLSPVLGRADPVSVVLDIIFSTIKPR
jgi:hypothetical protein